jgi:hypothetical protein
MKENSITFNAFGVQKFLKNLNSKHTIFPPHFPHDSDNHSLIDIFFAKECEKIIYER